MDITLYLCLCQPSVEPFYWRARKSPRHDDSSILDASKQSLQALSGYFRRTLPLASAGLHMGAT